MSLIVKKIILFNSNWGRREGTEKEKLIYSSSTPSLSDLTFNNCTTWNPGDRSSTNSDFYESSTESILEEERDDLKQVSLCEASINFIRSFSGNDEDLPVSIEGYGGSMLVFRRVENPGFWFVAVLIPDSFDPTSSIPSKNTHTNEYYVVYQLLGTLYSSFVRQNGTLKHVSTTGSMAGTGVSSKVRMRKVCQLFFEWNLPHAISGTGLTLPSPSPLNVFGGESESLMKYLSLDPKSFISIQSFVNHVTFSVTVHSQVESVFLYNDLIVSSSLDLTSTRILYSYVTSSIIPEIIVEELNRSKKRSSSNCYWIYDGKPQIIYLPTNLSSSNDCDSVQSSLINSGSVQPSTSSDKRSPRKQRSESEVSKPDVNDQQWIKKDLYVYRSVNGASLLIVLESIDPANVDERTELDRKSLLDNIDLYSKQHLYPLTANLSKISLHSKSGSKLTPQTSNITEFESFNVDPSISYLYYNEANASVHTNVGSQGTTSSVLKKQVSSGNFNSPMHRSSASTNSLQQFHHGQLLAATDPFTTWTTLESDFRTCILPTASKSLSYGDEKDKIDGDIDFPEPESSLEGSIEVIAKTDSDDHWIIFKRTDKRCLFATLMAHKNMNLQQIASLCMSKWTNLQPGGSSSKGGDKRRSEGTTSPSMSSSANNSSSCLPFANLFH